MEQPTTPAQMNCAVASMVRPPFALAAHVRRININDARPNSLRLAASAACWTSFVRHVMDG